ncbi:MAG: glycoside hydrolase family protein [Phycisphaeraceae bacterium]
MTDTTTTMKPPLFASALVPPERSQMFTMDGYYVWDGSLIRDQRGHYQLYASRWPANTGFRGWLTHSHVIRAESERAQGPFVFREQLDVLNEQPWSADMAHNARVYQIGDRYYMYYIGTRWGDADPVQARRQANDAEFEHWNTIRFGQRIAVATAPDAAGPWTPCPHNPILHPRPGQWDQCLTTNPAIHVMPDGRIGMIYKSTTAPRRPLWLGFAVANDPLGPFARDEPSLLFQDDIEDPHVWRTADGYRMLVKAMTAAECGIAKAGMLYRSDDGRHWRRASDRPAYDLNIHFRGEAQPTVARYVERPFLYVQDDQPRCLVNAVLIEPGPSGVLVRDLHQWTDPTGPDKEDLGATHHE